MHLAPRLLLLIMLATSPVFAQDATEHLRLGDQEHAAFHSEAALRHYDAALALDSTNATLLTKASGSAVDLGEQEGDKERKAALFRRGAELARRAVAANPSDAEAHFALARALGRAALNVGTRDRVKYAVEIREQALAALKIDPNHPGALHVLGMWNAEVMRLNGFEKFFAKNVLGGKVFGQANWRDAVSNLERAVQVDPDRLTHRLDLALIYRDIGEKAKARQQLDLVMSGKQTDVNDPIYKRQAEAALKKLL